jgi:hypothetical protein
LINAGYARPHAPRILAVVAALAFALTACGSDPFAFQWNDTPDTAKIYSLQRPELNIATAFGFYDGVGFPVESPGATGLWDAALDTRDGELVLLPPGALGVGSQALIASIPGMTFDDVIEAPGNTDDYEEDNPVPVVAGTVYVIRTGSRSGSFGSTCRYYSKMEPIDIDLAEQSLTFRYVTSPICNSRDLVPPQ